MNVQDRGRVVDAETGARMTGLKPATLRKWAQERRIPSLKVGNALRFRVADLRALIIERPAKG
jgi:excisionase family DNA binding protein